MKNTLMTLGFFLLMSSWSLQAQTVSSFQDEEKNMAKFNLLPLLGGKFSFEYERLLTPQIAVGTAVSLRPKKGLPFASKLKKQLNDEEFDSLIDNFSSSNFSITPEVRFYLSKRGAFRGFYLAPYAKYASYHAAVPVDFELDAEEIYSRSETIPLKGDIVSFTAGLSMGVNFKVSNKFYLDWRIFGPGYGTAKGDLTGKMALDADEQAELRDVFADLKTEMEDLPLAIKIDYDVHENGADVKLVKSPWAGIRTGLSIAYKF